MNKLIELTEYDKRTIEFFNKMAPSWDENSSFDESKVRSVLSIAGISERVRILDVACGTGVLIPCLLDKRPECVVAIDISPAMAEIAHKKFSDPCLTILNVDFHWFDDDGFDLITLFNSYPHFPDRARFIQHAYRLLNTGGRLLIFHDKSRDQINGRHKRNNDVKQVSTALRPCHEEAIHFSGLFDVDVMADTNHLYILSGTKR